MEGSEGKGVEVKKIAADVCINKAIADEEILEPVNCTTFSSNDDTCCSTW